MLDAIETAHGTSPILTIRTGAQPANCAAANSGTVLATVNLPADWMAAATGGTKGIAGGPWQDLTADAAGTAAHYRIHTNPGNVCEQQGSVGVGTGDLQLDNNVLALGQPVSITAWTFTAGNP
jgi:hypothetical protein